MTGIILSIAPIFILILFGSVLNSKFIKNETFWHTLSKLTYWVFMPALFFYKTSTMQINSSTLWQFAMAILSGFILAIALSLIVGKLLNFNNKVNSSVLQGSIRHNAFVALAIAGETFGSEAVALSTLAMAILIPASNIAVVSLLTILLQPKSNNYLEAVLKIIKGLFTNPLFLSISIGIIFGKLGFNNIPIIHDVCKLIGSIALPIILLGIGANMQFRTINADKVPIIVATIIKLIFFPLVVFMVGKYYFSLSQLELTIAVLFGALPTATSSFTFAMQMGGEHKLMSSIITIQTLLSFITISIILLALSDFSLAL